ncbi:thiamine-phosphate pyrophosphorylase [Pontibacillus halophilus JSM 076056 = DSM 19796]|uniref:Thiamine-phosphate synthase n=1 Tax=Pontibacillus halophilus JSM 076056 = DSM 19796 TaxID=1385510 RepID=A0A0A5GL29_9BACI|nr:thiamine phosphate synthase [Pontibacillus halophilus]KGX93966.1 thiamine-phosphate pyrophosphorylase [Pontibacillus halophilus JSM 076056 = DSM 19796]
MIDLRNYFIMGSQDCIGDPVETLRQAIQGGITCFQFREKGEGSRSGKRKEELARKLQQLCQEEDIPFIVNDDVALAKKLDADGIHVGQDDTAIETVLHDFRQKVVGLSTHTVEEALLANELNVDYIGVGPIYGTKTKPDAKTPSGPERIKEIRKVNVTKPIVGIGGIHIDNAREVMEAGADGVSYISIVSRSETPYEAARAMRQAVEEEVRY